MAHANNLLNQFKECPEAWRAADTILQHSTNINAKFLALTILDEAVNVSQLYFLLIIDSMENLRSKWAARNQNIYDLFGLNYGRRWLNKNKVSPYSDQTQLDFNFNRETRMEHLLAKLHHWHLWKRWTKPSKVRERVVDFEALFRRSVRF